jgi:hypothetical protein
MPENHKVKMKVGDVEFEAEGTPAEVQAQCDRFLAMMRGPKPAAPAPAPAPAAKPMADEKPADAPAMWMIKRFFSEGAGKK